MAVKKSEYRIRSADGELFDRLDTAAAVLIEGPKACGKTSTARQIAASEVFFDVDEAAREAASIDPAIVLEGDAPRLLDEWQIVPGIWNHVRRAADLQSGTGKFILTGSAKPVDDMVRHTGAGRITRMRMRTMSLFEQGHASGEVSVGELFAGLKVSGPESGLDIPDIVEIICRGGWPRTIDWNFARATSYVRDYVDEVRRTNIPQATGTRHDPNKVFRLMQSLARNLATKASLTTLAKDVSIDASPVTESTVGEYLDALERLFVVENQEPFAPHLRSRARLRTAPKRHFTDPSIAVAALRAAPEGIRRDPEYLGLLFESLVVRDLRIYAGVHDAEVRHYRDNTGLEVDAVIQTLSGQWMPLEVKLGGTRRIDEAAKSLLKLRDRVDIKRMGAPSKLVVVTATGYAYERPDGVSVVPIGLLGP